MFRLIKGIQLCKVFGNDLAAWKKMVNLSHSVILCSSRICHSHLHLCVAWTTCHWMINTSLIFISTTGVIFSTGNIHMEVTDRYWRVSRHNHLRVFCPFVRVRPYKCTCEFYKVNFWLFFFYIRSVICQVMYALLIEEPVCL